MKVYERCAGDEMERLKEEMKRQFEHLKVHVWLKWERFAEKGVCDDIECRDCPFKAGTPGEEVESVREARREWLNREVEEDNDDVD